jgi:putative membrane protein
MNHFTLPTLNATLNACAGMFLLLGWRAIKIKKDQATHTKYMVAAMISSTLFLCSYVTYHILVHGVTRYQGKGIWRIIYFFVLGTHTPLAMIILPFSIIAVWHAAHKNFVKHTQITRWLMPVWLYVSVTGVIVYFMLYGFKPI